MSYDLSNFKMEKIVIDAFDVDNDENPTADGTAKMWIFSGWMIVILMVLITLLPLILGILQLVAGEYLGGGLLVGVAVLLMLLFLFMMRIVIKNIRVLLFSYAKTLVNAQHYIEYYATMLSAAQEFDADNEEE